MKIALPLIVSLLFCSLLFSEDAVIVNRASENPNIDGILNDSEWRNATIVSDFRQRLPQEGRLPVEPTEVLLLYTSEFLYIGVRAFDSRPDSIVATVMKRDDFDIVNNDQFVIAIDSYNDGRNGYWFSTNPLGVKVDAQFFDEGNIFETNWDGIWECRSRITSNGWTAEIELPFSTLRMPERANNIMGINFFRRIIRTNEQLFSPLITFQYAAGTPNVSVARKYLFEGIRSKTRLEWKPYLLSSLTFTDQENESDQDIGFDARYRFASNTTANFSYNTDFAEAESDERQINFSRFSLFFPEKREFFLENSGLFSFGIPQQVEVFFSRNIGIVIDPAGATTAVPILFGAKVTSKIRSHDIGFMDVQTRSSPTSDEENFSVLRWKTGVAPRSYIGAIATNRYSTKDFYGTYGFDFDYFLTKEINARGFAATTIQPSRSGFHSDSSAFHLSLMKEGDRTSFHAGVLKTGEYFDPAIGFLVRDSFLRYNADLTVPCYFEGPVRKIAPAYLVEYYVGPDGSLQDSLHNVSWKTVFRSEDEFQIFYNRRFEAVPYDFRLFSSLTVPAGEYDTGEAGLLFTSKQGRRIAATGQVSAGSFYDGTRILTGGSVHWKINSHVTLSQSYETNDIKLDSGSFRTHLSLSRLNYSWNTRVSLAALLQYDNLSRRIGVNLQFAYLLKEGREFFLVYRQIEDTANFSGSRRRLARAIVLKFAYLFTF